MPQFPTKEESAKRLASFDIVETVLDVPRVSLSQEDIDSFARQHEQWYATIRSETCKNYHIVYRPFCVWQRKKCN